MTLYIKNELPANVPTKHFDKLMTETYGAVKNVGTYSVDIKTFNELNVMVRKILSTIGQTSVYPFITPFENSMMITLRQMDFSTRRFK